MKLLSLPPEFIRKSDTHKGNYGHVLVVGGSPGMTGAVSLCALAALRIGAGLVTVGIPESLQAIFQIKLTEIMSCPLADIKGKLCTASLRKILDILDKITVIVCGPGAGLAKTTQDLMIRIVQEVDKPLVVDADALTAIALHKEALSERATKNIILTPHLGEFLRLIKSDIPTIKKRRKELVKDFALRYNLTLVLKGNNTLVSDGKSLFENTTGNPGMATAGMGDVLAGIIGGLVAQGLTAYEAAKFAVFIHGLAGDFAASVKTQQCLIASDVIEYLPKAIKSLKK